MSRKIVNVLTFFSILLGEIYLLYISKYFFTIYNIEKNREIHDTLTKYICIAIFIFAFPSVIGYLRKTTRRDKEFIPTKEEKSFIASTFLTFFIYSILFFIISFILKDYSIYRTNLLLKYPLFNTITTYISIIGFNILYILGHFNYN